jgi:hypothetical protein
MNEKIKELLGKGGIPTTIGTSMSFTSIEPLEKLVEVVVRECVGIVENMSPGYEDYRNQIEDAFRRDCVEEIKYKFGIVDQENGELK